MVRCRAYRDLIMRNLPCWVGVGMLEGHSRRDARAGATDNPCSAAITGQRE